ncbi:MAG: 4Fe-4S binding protein [Candidatus Hadarchaeales archaeon]
MPRILPGVLKNLLKRPFTVKYPKKKTEPPDGYRGKPTINSGKCIRCWMCIRACPDRAISINKETKTPMIWLGRCTYCGECAEACPTRAIRMTKDFEFLDQYAK